MSMCCNYHALDGQTAGSGEGASSHPSSVSNQVLCRLMAASAISMASSDRALCEDRREIIPPSRYAEYCSTQWAVSSSATTRWCEDRIALGWIDESCMHRNMREESGLLYTEIVYCRRESDCRS